MINAEDAANLLLDMMIAGASKEELYSVIDDYKDCHRAMEDIEKMAVKYKFREPLDEMTTEERCRWFSNELMDICGGIEGSTAYEEALVFRDAADEIFTSNGIIETQIYLIESLKKGLMR